VPSTPAAEIRQDDKQRRQFQIFFYQLAVLPCLAVLGFRCCFTCSLLLLGMLLRPHPHPYYSDALFQPAGCWLGTKTRSFSRGDNLKWELARSIIRIADAIAGRTIIGLCKPALTSPASCGNATVHPSWAQMVARFVELSPRGLIPKWMFSVSRPTSPLSFYRVLEALRDLLWLRNDFKNQCITYASAY